MPDCQGCSLWKGSELCHDEKWQWVGEKQWKEIVERVIQENPQEMNRMENRFCWLILKDTSKPSIDLVQFFMLKIVSNVAMIMIDHNDER